MPFLSINLQLGFHANLNLSWLPLTIGVTAEIMEKTYDDLIQGNFKAPFKLSIATSGSISLVVGLSADVTARLALLVGGAGLGGDATLQANASATGELDAEWGGEKGLKLKGGSAKAQGDLTIAFSITGRAFVDLNLIFSKTNLWEKKWELAKTAPKTLAQLGVEAPFEFNDDNTPKPFDLKKVTFTPALDEKAAKDHGNEGVNPPGDKGTIKDDSTMQKDIRQQIRDNLRAKSQNQSRDMYAYSADLQNQLAGVDPKLTLYVQQAIEEELKALVTEQFWAFKNEVLNSKETATVKLGKIGPIPA